MIRHAAAADLHEIEETYREHFEHERRYGAYTVFREGVYPTKKDAEKALAAGGLFVCEERGVLLGSIILNDIQPEEYKKIDWPSHAPKEKVKVIHLLMVRPRAAGKGVGSRLIRYAEELAEKQGCTAIRLDTGAQNIPAFSLYQKMGFQLAAASSMKVGGAISHEKHLFLEKRIESGQKKSKDSGGFV